jgi:exodeoxyribonuclease V beta subunit
LWHAEHTVIAEILLNSPALNRNQYRAGSISGWLAQMTEYLALESPNGGLFENFHRFSAGRLAAAVKKGHQPPQHPFFTACDRLRSAHEQLTAAAARRLHALAVALLQYCRGELAERKRRRQVQSYDDLLLNLEQALHDRQGEALAAAIRQRYPVALIDEFQDTDPVQYRIFRRVYHGTSTAVFLVGDPKQAIYSFRGADIFAYLRACQDADRRYTLDVNWRCEPRLIQAVNPLFARPAAVPVRRHRVRACEPGRRTPRRLPVAGAMPLADVRLVARGWPRWPGAHQGIGRGAGGAGHGHGDRPLAAGGSAWAHPYRRPTSGRG